MSWRTAEAEEDRSVLDHFHGDRSTGARRNGTESNQFATGLDLVLTFVGGCRNTSVAEFARIQTDFRSRAEFLRIQLRLCRGTIETIGRFARQARG